MTDTGPFLTALRRVVRAVTGAGRRARLRGDAPRTTSVSTGLLSPGQAGPSATIEVDARRLRSVRLAYAPSRDGEPDPGEIVWTWVPYEENDGRGKDRPVLVVAAGLDGFSLAVQLTSKGHAGDRDHLTVGSGDWDGQHRESWVRLDRVFRVHAGSVRREAAFLPEKAYRGVAATLASRYGWDVG